MKKTTLGLILVAALAFASGPAFGQVATTSCSAVTTTGGCTTVETGNASSVMVQVTSASTSSCTVTIEQSLDNSRWTTVATITDPSSAGELWAGPAARYTRGNVTARASGTLSVKVLARNLSGDSAGSVWKKVDVNGASSTYTAITTTTLTSTTDNTTNLVVSGSIQGNQTVKALTETTATTFEKVNVGTGTYVSGSIAYQIEATDATDYQTRVGILPFSAVNKAGTITCTVGTVTTATEVASVSTGTLTNTFTCADAGSGVLNLLANATSSLTQTVLNIRYRTSITGSGVTVTPQ